MYLMVQPKCRLIGSTQLLTGIQVRFYCLLISRRPYNGALLIKYTPVHWTPTRLRSGISAASPTDTAIALCGISRTTPAHALRFNTKSTGTANILIAISTKATHAKLR